MKLLQLFKHLRVKSQKPSKLKKIRRGLLLGLLVIIIAVSSFQIWDYINPSKTTEAAWYSGATGVWAFRKKITINNTQVAGDSDYTNFPVVLNNKFPELADHAQSDGGDIVFTSSDGVTILTHEIEYFDKLSGNLTAWIEIPTLDGDADTSFFMYYGNAITADMQDIASMWDSITYSSVDYTFKAVWHMSQNPDTAGESILDSSQNGNDADPSGMTQASNSVDSILGKGLLFEDVDEYMIADEDTVDFGTSDFSIIFWNKLPNELPSAFTHDIINKKNGPYTSMNNIGWGLLYNDFGTNGYHGRLSDGDGPATAWDDVVNDNKTADNGNWNHIALTVDRNGNANWYDNSVIHSDITTHQGAQSSLDVSEDLAFCTGSESPGTAVWNCGTLDEVWIFLSVIPENIIATAYNNQKSGSSFYTSIGSPESRREPRAHWKMDEGTGPTIYDAIGERTDGTATSTTWETTQANCIMGYCLTFGSANNRVTVSDNFDLDFTAGTSFTLEAWIKHDTASAQQVIVSKYNEAGYKLLMESDGDLTCGIDYDSTWGSTNFDSVSSTLQTYDDNIWHHVVCVKNANTSLTLYIDGVSVGTPDTSLTNSTLANSDPFYIGIDADAASFDWVGVIDEVKLYDYARSAQEILTDYNIGFSSSGSNAVLGRFAAGSPIPDMLISRWKFDDMEGTNIEDSITTGVDLTLSSASWTPYGKMGGAYLGISNNRAARTDNANLDFTASDTFSLTGWFKRSAVSNAEYLLYKENGSEGYTVYMDSDGDVVFGIGDTNSVSFPEETIGGSLSANFDDDQWHHFAAIKNGTTGIYLYVDGILIASDTSLVVDATLENAGSFYVGDANATDGTDEWLGLVDDIKVFDVALTASQVKVDYNAISAVNFGTGAASESAYTKDGAYNSPVGYYRLDENTGTSTTYDESGNGRNGTLTNVDAEDWVPGKYGSSLSLTAAGTEYIEVGTGPSDVETVTFWVKPTATTDDFINLISTTTYIDASSGTVRLEGQASETVYVNGILNGTITTDVWQHVAVVSASSLNASNLEIGRVGATPSYFNGVIDEVKLFDVALTQAQIAYDYNRGKPVGWWRLDEPELNWCGTNTDGCDASGFGYDLLAQANATTVSITGKFSGGLELDGTGDFYCLDDDDNGSCDTSTTKLQFSGDLTLSAWINLDTFTDADTIIYQGENGSDTEANNELYFLRIDTTSGNDIEYGHESSTGIDNYQVFDTNLSVDTWYHLTLVRNTTANTVQLYLNGVPTGSASSYSTDPTGGSTGDWAIGANDNGTNDTDGTIDDVRVYNYAMSANQVKSIVNNGSVRFD